MSALAIVFRNETIKISRRLAFWVAFVGLCTLSSLMGSGNLRAIARLKDPTSGMLPNWWARVLNDIAPPTMFFSAAIIVLLVASEFAWRTSRQNVIDGLSKEQWFVGKLLNVPAIALAMALAAFLILGAFGVAASDFSRSGVELLRRSDVVYLAGFITAVFGFASLAFMIAMMVRNPGPALAVFFLYIFIEQMGRQLLVMKAGSWAKATVYLPVQVYITMTQGRQWYASPQSEQLIKSGRMLSPETAFIVGWAFIALFVFAAFINVRQRDM